MYMYMNLINIPVIHYTYITCKEDWNTWSSVTCGQNLEVTDMYAVDIH